MVGMVSIKDDEIGQICRECALARGWKPSNKQVGVWPGACDVCGEDKVLCAPRDWIRPLDSLSVYDAILQLATLQSRREDAK